MSVISPYVVPSIDMGGLNFVSVLNCSETDLGRVSFEALKIRALHQFIVIARGNESSFVKRQTDA